MKLIYAVYDKKSKNYGLLVSSPHDAVATRDFVAAVSEPQSALGKFPEDFELHCVGTFYDTSFDGTQVTEQGILPIHVERDPVKGYPPRVVITASAVKALQEAKDNGGA